MKPWAGYTRVSRVGDRKETLISPDQQADRIFSYAAQRSIEVHMLEPELDVSGSTVERPVLEQAIQGVEGGRFAGIIVAHIDRLSRMRMADAYATIERIEGAGGQVIAVAQNFDIGTPAGRMGRDVFLAMAKMQWDQYGEHFADVKRRAIERGIWVPPIVPLGYRKGTDRKLKPDPKPRRRIVAAFEARARGKSWREVADVLGVGLTTAHKLIRNRVYLGEIAFGEWRNPDAHEPIVPRDLWEQAQIAHPRPPRNTPNHQQMALLAGIVRCASCRYVMTHDARPPKKGGRIYRCTRRKATGVCPAAANIQAKLIEPYVEKVVLGNVDALTYSSAERTDRITEAESQLAAAEVELDSYQRVMRVSELGDEAFAAGMTERAQAVATARVALANARLVSMPVPGDGTLAKLWPELSIVERRHVLRGTLGVIWVKRGRAPVDERVAIITAGFEPSDLPIPGGWRRRSDTSSVEGIHDLEGALRMPGA
jgi:DNA invertase Pin-like site-specific DNA recombinase